MSLPPGRWPGFWNSVTSARTRRKMTTHRAKLRKLGFIGPDLPPGEVNAKALALRDTRVQSNLGTSLSLAKGSETSCVIFTARRITAAAAERFRADYEMPVPAKFH